MRLLVHLIRMSLIMLSMPRYVAMKCGHKTKRLGWLSSFGITKDYLIPFNGQDRLDYCHACLSQMSIRCGWCGEPILIGDPVTLFSLSDVNCDEAHKDAMIYKIGSMAFLIGCFDINCVSGVLYCASFWVPGADGKGRVRGDGAEMEDEPNPIDPSITVADSVEEALMLLEDENLLVRPMPSDRIH